MKRPFWKRPPIWSPPLGYFHLLIVGSWKYDALRLRLKAAWRELTWTKRQRAMQIVAGIRDKNGKIKRK